MGNKEATAGFEPAIFSVETKCNIHYAMRPDNSNKYYKKL